MEKESELAAKWHVRLNNFHNLVSLQERLQRLKTLILSGLVLCIAYLFFVLFVTPYSSLLSLGLLFLLPLLLLLTPLIIWLVRRVEKKRYALAHSFFEAGFKLDAAGRLTTNAAHSKVVAEPAEKYKQREMLR